MSAPPPADVPGNAWTAVEVSEVGGFTPLESVSVVVSGPDPDGHLPLTLAALSEQSYPRSLTEVVVEVDPGGSGPGMEGVSGDLTVKRSSPAEALAAAEGDVVLFVPAGALPERELVEAHARWHHAVSDAASAGVTRRIDAGGLEPGPVGEAQREGRLQDLLRSRTGGENEDTVALEAFLERSGGLTEQRPDLFRVAARGTVAVRAETLRAAGEPAEVRDHRLARLDLAYRLDCAGCLFVPERAALGYTPYPEPWIPTAETSDAAAEEPAATATATAGVPPRGESLIPVRGFRRRGSGRVFERPAMVVNVSGEERGAAEVLESVDAVLRGRLSDLVVRVQLSGAHPERALVEAACAADPRVRIGPPSTDGPSDVPYQVTMPADALVDDGALDAIHAMMGEERIGALHVTVPSRAGRLPLRRAPVAERFLRRSTVEVVASGPLARARRVAAHRSEAPEAVLGRLFDERRVDGAGLGIRRRGAAAEPESGADDALGPAADLAHERAEHLRYRARAATSQARLDRQAQRLFRERLRSGHERTRAERLEARLARLDPRFWVRWKARRVSRRVSALPARLWQRVEALREPLYRRKQAALARIGRGPGGSETGS